MSLYIDIRGRLENIADIEPLVDMVRAACEERRWPYRVVDDVIENVAVIHVSGGGAGGGDLGRTIAAMAMPVAAGEEGQTGSEIKERLHRWGIVFRPHFRCDPVALLFDADTGGVLGDEVQPNFFPGARVVPLGGPKYVRVGNTGLYSPGMVVPSEPEGRMVWGWHPVKTVYAGGQVHCLVCDLLNEVVRRFPGLQIKDTGGYMERGDAERIREIARGHVETVGALTDAASLLPGVELVSSGAQDRRVDPLERLLARSTAPYDRLSEPERLPLQRNIGALSAQLGLGEITPANADEVVFALDAHIRENRAILQEESDDADVLEWQIAACYGACIIALLGGNWEKPQEEEKCVAPLLLRGVSVVTRTVDPLGDVRSAMDHLVPKSLTRRLDGIRWDEESYLATYGPPHFQTEP